ncbi:hypothetical protein H0H93_016828 [Arthromyces matolae]|nr:hypothetical protein H0H93_016828 [Arthromyces matolae]
MSRPVKRFKAMKSVSSLLSNTATASIPRTSYRIDEKSGKTASSTSILHVPSTVQPEAGLSIPDDEMLPPSIDDLNLPQSEMANPRAPRIRTNTKERWRLHDRDLFLRELLRWEGCGDTSQPSRTYRCLDCDNGGELLDLETLLNAHYRNPLHRIERWTGEFFTQTSLKSLGLQVQLGHPFGHPCGNPHPGRKDFIVIHTNGLHNISINYCACEHATSYAVQLLRHGWYPSTSDRPATVASMAVLRHFQMLSFESKASSYEFYNTLVRLTDNTGMNRVPDRYRAFMTMIRQYRHLKMLKRSGRGHDPEGILHTKPGEYNWADSVPEKKFLYRLFLAVDANFRLKRKHRSSEKADPSLSEGWSYFVPEQEFQEFLKVHGHTLQPAVDSERSTKGLATTGVVGVDCARHDMKRPLGVGNLCQGERLAESPDVIDVVVSYDIFHLPAHVMACQTPFSFNFNRFVGRTDGEGIERGWSHINPVATSTREMGPGHRRDTIDDHFATSLLRKIKDAVPEASDHRQHLEEFESNLERETLQRWKKELEDWEVDHSKSNPYVKQFSHVSEAFVRKALAENDAVDLKKGHIYALHDTVSASQLITMGLDLEEKQRQLAVEAISLKDNATDTQKTKYQTQSTTLRRKITAWISIQHLYIPGLSLVRDRDAISSTSSTEEAPFDTALYLPSSCPTSAYCDPRLKTMEWELRTAQAGDALSQLRDALRLRSYLYMDKDRFQFGQRQNTRSRSLISRVEARKTGAVVKYRTARTALQRLSGALGKVGVDAAFPELRDQDIKSLRDRDGLRVGGRPSEGRHEMSWIWKRLGTLEKENELLQDDLRIEWCKSKARADRWKEEVQLLREEMRRVPLFFRFRSRWWREQATQSTDGCSDEPITRGMRAYALDQSAMYEAMAVHCERCWALVDSYVADGGSTAVVPVDVDISEENSEGDASEGDDDDDENENEDDE